MTLEMALEYIEDDELVEVTPTTDPPPQEGPQGNRPQAQPTARPNQSSKSKVDDSWPTISICLVSSRLSVSSTTLVLTAPQFPQLAELLIRRIQF